MERRARQASPRLFFYRTVRFIGAAGTIVRLGSIVTLEVIYKFPVDRVPQVAR